MESTGLNLNQRINVIGTSGCGKTTFSKQLAQKMQLPYVEIDKIFWGPGWSMPADKVFFEKLETALSADAWVLDGNYTRTTFLFSALFKNRIKNRLKPLLVLHCYFGFGCPACKFGWCLSGERKIRVVVPASRL